MRYIRRTIEEICELNGEGALHLECIAGTHYTAGMYSGDRTILFDPIEGEVPLVVHGATAAEAIDNLDKLITSFYSDGK